MRILQACSFAAGGWHPDDWMLVKSARWDWMGSWEQQNDHICNRVPKEASPEDLISTGSRAPETYASMLSREELPEDVVVQVSASFDYRMAPLVVLAAEPGVDHKGRLEYREHFEVVIFDQGINLWHHVYMQGRPLWIRAAYSRFELGPGMRHMLEVERKGRELRMRVGEHEMGCRLETLPRARYAGITGCEGVNRFYDFKVCVR